MPNGRPVNAIERRVGVKREARWQHGWLARAERIDSPNFGPRPVDAPIDLVVLHSISLPPGEYGGDAIERLFTNRLDWSSHPYFEQIRGAEVSAHFVIRRDGRLVQFVSCDQRAWHAGKSTWRGRDNCNDNSIGIELEGLEGQLFEAAQYDVLVELMKSVSSHYPLRGVAGHEHVAPGRKRDPGAGFDWSLLKARLGWPKGCFPSEEAPRPS